MSSVRVVYVAGSPRSGSILLTAMSSQLLGGFFGGELRRVVPQLREPNPCGCGVSFPGCAFWQQVGQNAFGGWDTVDVEELSRRYETVLGYGSLPALLQPRLRPRLQRDIDRLAEFVSRLYSAIADVSGTQLVSDGSKDPLYAALLRRVSAIDLRIVHLIRDPRAVAFSSAKPGRGPVSTFRSAAAWDLWNALFSAYAAAGARRLVVRYEQLIADPAGTLAAVAEHAGVEEVSGLDRLRAGTFELRAHHGLGGKVGIRMQTGELRLAPDDAWRDGLPRRARLLTDVLTLPMLVRYGYLGRR